MLTRLLILLLLLVVPSHAWAGPRTSLGSVADLGSMYSGAMGIGEGVTSSRPKFGIRAGDFVVQPRLFVESFYSSNFFREDERNLGVALSEVMAMRLRPGVAIYNPGFTNVAVSMAVDADALLPMGDDERVKDQADLGGDVHGKIDLFPKRALTLALSGRFKRELWTRPSSGTRSADRNDVTVGTDLAFHPGGRALELRAGYKLNLLTYDDMSSQDTDSHNFSFQTSWRFFPLSYLVLDASMRMVDYPEDDGSVVGAVGYHSEASPWKVIGGMNGYFSERLALRLRGGYGDAMVETGANHTGPIADVRLTYRFGMQTAWHFGYNMDFETAALGGFYTYHRGYSALEQNLGTLGRLHLDVGVDLRTFGTYVPANSIVQVDGVDEPLTVTASDANRTDMVVRAGLLMDFDFSRLFGLTAGYRYESTVSDYSTTSVFQGESQAFFAGYTDHRVLVSLNLRY